MTVSHGFELLREEQVHEVNALVRHYRHIKTGAELLSFINDDENKVFGVSFATPPSDSTGIAHILEHSVLCGSEKFPVKKPFVEMLKGSLHTFLNAMTFPDKTVYPVASQNLADFYNLTSVYLDATFFPLLKKETFLQEGWHLELENMDDDLIYKGVVFNEMKGAYSNPDQVFNVKAQGSLFPDTIYGFSSGGDPVNIPDLTFENFVAFHKQYYHPSNAQLIFYGNDDPEKRLEILDACFSQFERSEPAPLIALQPRFTEPKNVEASYPGDDANPRSSFVTLNWMLDPSKDTEEEIARTILSLALIGNSAAPLHKKLTEAGLGEAVMGRLNSDFRQPWFYTGLRNANAADADKIQALILETLTDLCENGIDPATIEATVNSLEFQLRENNSGGYPRGILYFFAALGEWLYGGDPLEGLRYETALASVKVRLASGERVLENLIASLLLNNTHRTRLVLKADPTLAQTLVDNENAKLQALQAAMSDAEKQDVIAVTQALKAAQNAVDNPADLAKLPSLTLEDLPRHSQTVETKLDAISGITTYVHEQPTNGIAYIDLAFGMSGIPANLLQLLPLFSRALTQTGTAKEDFVSLSQHMGRTTGGISASRFISAQLGSDDAVTKFMLRGKAVYDRLPDFFEIAIDVLTSARLDNRDRIRQIVAQSKASFESSLVQAGHQMVFSRLRASLHQADWLGEQLGGISQLFYLRELSNRIENDWDAVQKDLEALRHSIITSADLIINITAEAEGYATAKPMLAQFITNLPSHKVSAQDWGPLPTPKNEALTILAAVNYVGKGASLAQFKDELPASLTVITKYLGTSYLWDKIRVEGGAYGGFARFDSLTASYAFGSYRDPNITASLDVYDKTSEFLRQPVSDTDLTRSIIGTIGDLDPYLLPDAKGFGGFARKLTHITDEYRQARRDQVLATSKEDFLKAADLLDEVSRNGHVVVMGSEPAIEAANRSRNGFLDITKVM